MDDKLLDDVGIRGAVTERESGGSKGHQKGSSGDSDWSWLKRLRLQRHPSLGTVDEDRAAAKSANTGRQDYFGVRSYLHHFYDHGRVTSPAASSHCKYNWRTRGSQGQCSGVYWWKTMAMFGAGCLVIGIVTIIAGFLTPTRPIVVGPELNGDGQRLNDDAAAFDFRLEICRMVGLTMFCAGGLILAVSLMVPTFFYHSCSSAAGEEVSSHPVIVDADGSDSDGDPEQAQPLPIKSAVPATERLTEVQPPQKVGESAIISDTLIPYD